MPSANVLMFTAYSERALLTQALEAGARGYILKEASHATLVRAIEKVAEGSSYIDPGLLPDFLEGRDRDDLLTAREREILQLLANGMSNADAAAKLFISQETVKSHVRYILTKLEADTRTPSRCARRSSSSDGWRRQRRPAAARAADRGRARRPARPGLPPCRTGPSGAAGHGARRTAYGIDLDLAAADELTEKAHIALYQILREALEHAVRRGPPTRVRVAVALTGDGGVEVMIADDGTEKRRRGHFDSLKERTRALNGRVTVDRPAASGTTIVVRLPAHAARR